MLNRCSESLASCSFAVCLVFEMNILYFIVGLFVCPKYIKKTILEMSRILLNKCTRDMGVVMTADRTIFAIFKSGNALKEIILKVQHFKELK